MAKETIDFINEEEFVDIFVEDEDNQIDVFIEDDIISNDITIEDDTESADITVDDTESETNLVVEADEVEDISAELFDDFLKGDKGEKGEAGITDYEKLENLPEINETKIKGKLTLDELGIMEKLMTPIELSTDITNPTEVMNFINRSGTYVAKNAGVIGTNGEPMVVLAKGQFFSIHNLKDYANELGLGDELPDSENVIDIDGRLITGEHVTVRIYGNGNMEQLTWLNSENVNDYVDGFNPSDFINTAYGIKITNNQLAIYSATIYDIDNGGDIYKPITPNNIEYAVQSKGSKHFVKKTDFAVLEKDFETLETNVETLNTNTQALLTEIETILDSVVSVNE